MYTTEGKKVYNNKEWKSVRCTIHKVDLRLKWTLKSVMFSLFFATIFTFLHAYATENYIVFILMLLDIPIWINTQAPAKASQSNNSKRENTHTHTYSEKALWGQFLSTTQNTELFFLSSQCVPVALSLPFIINFWLLCFAHWAWRANKWNKKKVINKWSAREKKNMNMSVGGEDDDANEKEEGKNTSKWAYTSLLIKTATTIAVSGKTSLSPAKLFHIKIGVYISCVLLLGIANSFSVRLPLLYTRSQSTTIRKNDFFRLRLHLSLSSHFRFSSRRRCPKFTQYTFAFGLYFVFFCFISLLLCIFFFRFVVLIIFVPMQYFKRSRVSARYVESNVNIIEYWLRISTMILTISL